MASILTNSFFNPARGGHAPGDLRNAFFNAVEAYDSWLSGEQEPTVELRQQQLPISQVCGLLWNCTDTVPTILRSYFRDWDEPEPGSYSTAARLLRLLIADAALPKSI